MVEGDVVYLKRLVTALTATMIAGILTITVLLVMRLGAEPPPPPLPEDIALPEDARVLSVTYGPGWYLVVTTDGRGLVYDAAGGLRREVPFGTE